MSEPICKWDTKRPETAEEWMEFYAAMKEMYEADPGRAQMLMMSICLGAAGAQMENRIFL